MHNPLGKLAKLAKLALDAWYKVMIVVGAFIIIFNGAGLLPRYPTKETFLIAAGCVLWGIGEWNNHPRYETLHPRTAAHPASISVEYPWSPSPLGCLFDLIGLGLIGCGIYLLFF